MSSESGTLGLIRQKEQIVVIEAAQIFSLWLILVSVALSQLLQPGFINFQVFFPILVGLVVAFGGHALFLLNLDLALARNWPTAILFAVMACVITIIIFVTGASQSILMFLFLINIILCGLVFRFSGGNWIALLSCVLFNFNITLSPETAAGSGGQSLLLSVGLNNLAFFAVANLAGYLGEQMSFMDRELFAQRRSLSDLKNLNELIVQSVATGLITCDRNWTVVLFNKSALEILDLPTNLVDQKPLTEILKGLDCVALAKKLEHVNSVRVDHAMQLMGESSTRLFEILVSKISEGTIGSSGYVVAFQDLTTVRRLEFAMRQSEKLAAVGQLAAGIAHEIRNPLASISGSIQMLKSEGMEPQDQAKLMAIVLKEIDRLNNLISEFLEYVKPEQAYTDRIDLNFLITEICEFVKLNASLRKDTEQVLRLSSKRAVLGKKEKLKQAILNIVMNAYQAMQDQPNAKVEVTTEDEGAHVLIKIKDVGVGIEEARIRKIFDPFHTTKPRGTGLGLAVTHKIIEGHGGSIEVQSQVMGAQGASTNVSEAAAHGTTFLLRLPAAPDERSQLA